MSFNMDSSINPYYSTRDKYIFHSFLGNQHENNLDRQKNNLDRQKNNLDRQKNNLDRQKNNLDRQKNILNGHDYLGILQFNDRNFIPNTIKYY